MATTLNILKSRREIVGGPGEHKTKIALPFDPETEVQITVRGLTSDCDHAYGNTCESCKDSKKVWIRFMGSFNPRFEIGNFTFWGIISKNIESLRNIEYDPDKLIVIVPDDCQFVMGMYNPKSTMTLRGWIQPCKMSVFDTHLALRNDSLTRPKVWGDMV